ncbi:MAG: hypothetical protein OHK0050_39140 [Roseiflexaceae bacterium]
MMLPHHQAAVARVTAYFADQTEVLGLLLGGSVAHGFARPNSDIDILIIVTPESYAQRVAAQQLQFFTRDLCEYPDGYVDGKYLSPIFLQQVAERGSEPARFAFRDSHVLIDRMGNMADQVAQIAAYPEQGRIERIKRFHAQFLAWSWYLGEAHKHSNRYLQQVASSKMILFGCRMILAEQRLLYPYHKWMLRVLEQVPDLPPGLLSVIDQLSHDPAIESAQHLHDLVLGYRPWELDSIPWPNRFMRDRLFLTIRFRVPQQV